MTKDSNNQGSNQKSNNEIESHEDCMKISEEEASESGNPQLRGQFWHGFSGFFSISEKNPHSDTWVCIGCGYDKNGRCYQTSEGWTKVVQDTIMRRNKMMTADLNSRVGYLKILLTKPNNDEYTKAIEVINDCYRKMLMIG